VLIDLKTDQLLFGGLAMPHSPILYNNELYLLFFCNYAIGQNELCQ